MTTLVRARDAPLAQDDLWQFATTSFRRVVYLSPAPGGIAPLRLGRLVVWPPVALAPMAGVTNPPFRTLCKEFGAGLYVSEMITARALVLGNRKTVLLASFSPVKRRAAFSSTASTRTTSARRCGCWWARSGSTTST